MHSVLKISRGCLAAMFLSVGIGALAQASPPPCAPCRNEIEVRAFLASKGIREVMRVWRSNAPGSWWAETMRNGQAVIVGIDSEGGIGLRAGNGTKAK
jgi:hypothetical protein